MQDASYGATGQAAETTSEEEIVYNYTIKLFCDKNLDFCFIFVFVFKELLFI